MIAFREAPADGGADRLDADQQYLKSRHGLPTEHHVLGVTLVPGSDGEREYDVDCPARCSDTAACEMDDVDFDEIDDTAGGLPDGRYFCEVASWKVPADSLSGHEWDSAFVIHGPAAGGGA